MVDVVGWMGLYWFFPQFEEIGKIVQAVDLPFSGRRWTGVVPM